MTSDKCLGIIAIVLALCLALRTLTRLRQDRGPSPQSDIVQQSEGPAFLYGVFLGYLLLLIIGLYLVL
jgi:hypothetical protein